LLLTFGGVRLRALHLHFGELLRLVGPESINATGTRAFLPGAGLG